MMRLVHVPCSGRKTVDAMLFRHHTLSVFRLAYSSRALLRRLISLDDFFICVVKCSLALSNLFCFRVWGTAISGWPIQDVVYVV